ncbi:MAG TPA: hypothetical protein VKA46_19840 [Gemmataceae bacterium]|nr:hypothetical protein [Gemmataceae bacterium]
MRAAPFADSSDPLDQLQSILPDGVPAWAVVAGVGVLLLIVLLLLVRKLWRALFGRAKESDAWDRELDVNLDECPLPTRPVGQRQLTVYHQPARLRLVVVAGVGREATIDATAVEKLLDKVVPGLGAAAQTDRPRVRVWPPQMSHHGFTAAFHRHTRKAAGRGEPSRWVLLAGRAQAGRQPVMVGLGLWADEPNTIDRVNLEQHQWLDVLRLVPV